MVLQRYLGIALIAIPFLCISANGQYVNYRVTKAPGKLVLVWDSPGNQFTLEVKGNDVTTGILDLSGRIFFEADGIFMIVQPAMVSQFVKSPDAGRMDSLALLQAHRDWEVQYVETEVLSKKLDVKATPQKLADGRDALLWEYRVPKGTNFPKTQMMVYLTVLNGDKFVLMLNCQLKSKDQAGAARLLLLSTAATIQPTLIPHDGPVVLERKQKRN